MSQTPAPLPPPQPGQSCPCGSGQPFEACCGPLIAGERPAASAEKLMRSRFTAHVANDYAYLHRTYQATAKLPYVAEEDDSNIQWTRLAVHSHDLGKVPDTAFVDFTAYFVEDGAERALHEKSEFHRVDGNWLYTRPTRQGPAPAKAAAKVGRNDPCPCGSGKKYKQCCLVKA
jgi:SEC-C motif-containing protein